MKSNILILFFTLIFSSCSINHYKTSFARVETLFDKDLIEHFPKKVIGNYTLDILYPDGSEMANRCTVILLVNEEADRLQEVKQDCLNKAKQIIKPSNRCALIVSRLENIKTNVEERFIRMVDGSNNVVNKEKYEEELNKLMLICDSLTLPIPNFSIIENNKKPIKHGNRLSDDFTLYILDAKSGKYIDEEYLTQGDGLPENWKNGCSKGVAINEKENIIIYWLEIW
jgi:hypothetical protein